MAHNFFDPNVSTDIKARDVAQIPYKEGQFLMTSDTNSIYYDFAEGRKRLTDIIELDTEAQRQAILVPISKFYFVKETGKLWRYLNGSWADILTAYSARSFIKIFTATDWTDGKLVIPASEHKLSIENNCVGSNVFALVNGVYTTQAFAAMDTDVSIMENKSIVLSASSEGFAGRVIVYV